jgi:hypothetical protein
MNIGYDEIGYANDKKHKYYVIVNGVKIKFGSYDNSDFLIHKNKIRRDNF